MTTATQSGLTHFEYLGTCELVATRVVTAPRSLVWDVWTNPIHVPHWMTGPEGMSMPICEIDLRVGGSWRYVWRMPNGEHMEMTGVYKEIVPHTKLVCTECWGGDWPETLNTLVLTEEEGKTTMTCTVRYPTEAAREAATATGMKEGWAHSYEILDKYMATL